MKIKVMNQSSKLFKSTQIWMLMPILIFMLSCHDDEVSQKLQLAEQLVWENPDSVIKILERIPSPEMLGGKERADYALLLTQAEFRCAIPPTSDSLISIAVEYYKNRKYIDRKVASLLYKGEILTELGKDKEAMVTLKEAESYIPQIQDARIESRIYNAFGYSNRKHCNYQIAMEYYKKALNIDTREQYISWKVGDLINLANISNQFANEDSVNSYYIQALEMTSLVDSVLNAKIYHNIGFCKMQKGKFVEAEKFLLKSLKYSSSSKTQFLLIDLYTQKGQEERVDSLRSEMLKTSDITTRINIYHSLYKESVKKEDFKQAVNHMELCIEALDYFRIQTHQSKMLEIQNKYDWMILQKENVEIQNRWYVTILISILIIGILCIIYYISMRIYRKSKVYELIKYQNEKDYLLQKIDDCQIRIEEDETLHKDEKDSLIKNIDYLKEEVREKDVQIHRMEVIYKSKDVLVPIEYVEALKVYLKINAELSSYIPSTERLLLRNWLDLVYDGFASRLLEKYALTSREQDVCFLKVLGLSDEKIAFLLNNQLRSVDRCLFRVYEKAHYLGSKADFIKNILLKREL